MRFRKVNSSPIKNTSGEILGAVAVVRDITEEKLANQRLLYQSMLLDNIHDAVIAMDANLKITLWNRSAEILSGMKAEQAIGKYFYNIVDRVGVSFLDREADRKRLDQEGILLTEYTYRAQDGRTAVLESIDIALHTESGEVIGYIVASRDVTRRKQVETALLESERKYRELVRYAPVGIYELDFRTQRFVSINDVICQLTGYSREELMEMNPLDILDDEGKNRFRNRMKQWLSGEQPEENVEYRVIAKDGHEIYAVLNVNFTADEKGNPVGATVIGYDVTERVQAKLALEAANQRINEILESIKDVFYSLDHDWRFTYVNQRAFDVWGKQSDELIGKSIWEVFPQLLETVAYQYLHQAMRDRSQVQYEHLSPVVGRWISVHVYPSADGGLTIYFQDISERKKIEAQLFDEFKKLQQTQAALQESEAQLRKSEERFQLVLKGTPITVYTMDATLRYTWAYNLRHGASPEMLLGKRDDELMSSERAAPLLAIKQSVLESGRGTRQEVDITVRGEDFVYDMSVDPIFDEHGKACGITVIAVDITDRIRLDQQIQANRVRLELQQLLIDQREHERLQIARDLHDGPIQDLTGAYYTLKSLQIGMVDETLRQAISNVAETVQSQVDELRAYMQDLRPPTLEKFGLEPAIRSHLENFQTKYSELEIAFLPQPLPYPLADTAGLALYRICQESMNNIAKHANAHRVEIHLWSDDDWVNLEIQDDGIGFDLPSDWLGMARQGHLGLVGIRERVEAINGRLAVDTRAGKGTRLLVSIPIS